MAAGAGRGLLSLLALTLAGGAGTAATAGGSRDPQRATDLYVRSVVLHAPLDPTSREASDFGTRPQIERYDLHSGLAPATVDATVIASSEIPTSTRVALEVFPVVGMTGWQDTEGQTEAQLLASSKTQLAAFYRWEQEVRVEGRTECVFAAIDLDKLVRFYRDIGYWPADLVFRVTIHPVRGESSLSNNVMEFRLPMIPPD